MRKTVFTKKSIDVNRLVNIDTGELLSSSHPNLSSINEKTSNILISSDEYIVFDSDSLRIIKEIFNDSDLGRILLMGNMVSGPLNILHKSRESEHDTESLMIELSYSLNKFRDFMKRLHVAGVVAYLDVYRKQIKYRHILFNPRIARKGKVFSEEILKHFERFDERLLDKKRTKRTYNKKIITDESNDNALHSD